MRENKHPNFTQLVLGAPWADLGEQYLIIKATISTFHNRVWRSSTGRPRANGPKLASKWKLSVAWMVGWPDAALLMAAGSRSTKNERSYLRAPHTEHPI